MRDELTQALGDIEIAMKVLSDGEGKTDVHPIDRHYQQLGCKMEVLEHDSDTFKVDHILTCKCVLLFVAVSPYK